MKKIILALLVITPTLAFSQTPPVHSCSFYGGSLGQLEARAGGNEHLFGADFENGLGIPATIGLRYTGSSVVTVNAVSNLNKQGGGMPQSYTVETGVKFNKPLNNLAASGARNFSAGFKNIAIVGDDTEQTDTMTVRMLARSSSPFPVGTYDASATVTCY